MDKKIVLVIFVSVLQIPQTLKINNEENFETRQLKENFLAIPIDDEHRENMEQVREINKTVQSYTGSIGTAVVYKQC
jgi:hypothetical protein